MHSLWLVALLLAAPPANPPATSGEAEPAYLPNKPAASEPAETDSSEPAPAEIARQLRQQINAALRQESATRAKTEHEKAHLSAVFELIGLYQALQTDSPMTERETLSMLSRIRFQLHRVATELKKDLHRQGLAEQAAQYDRRRRAGSPAAQSPGESYQIEATSPSEAAQGDLLDVTVTRSPLAIPTETVLFQIGVALGGQNGGADAAGEALIKVIKGATGRQKWDDLGGPGSIHLFKGSSLIRPAVDSLYEVASYASTRALAGALGGRAVEDHGPELVELIETVIAPKTWEKNGGFGSILYYAPLRVIVVRTTGEVHHNVGNVFGNLRAAGN